MSEPVEVVRELYAAVAAGDRDAIAVRLAPQVRWQGRERGPATLRVDGVDIDPGAGNRSDYG